MPFSLYIIISIWFRNKSILDHRKCYSWIVVVILNTPGPTRMRKGISSLFPCNVHMFVLCTHTYTCVSLQWRHKGSHGVSNHQPRHCLLSRLFGRRSRKTSKLRVTGLCAGNSPGTVEFPAQMASNAENASIWWRHLANNPCPSITGHLFKFSLKSTAWLTPNIQGGVLFN